LHGIDFLCRSVYIAGHHRFAGWNRSTDVQLNFDLSDVPARRYRPARSREHPAIPAAEQAAQRIGEALFTVIGPLFWLAIILAFAATMLDINVPT
jgi:hypothetical protein